MPELYPISQNTLNISLDSVSYMCDMLVQMQKMAAQQHQRVLAHLLSLAAEEARALKKDYTRDTFPPG